MFRHHHVRDLYDPESPSSQTLIRRDLELTFDSESGLSMRFVGRLPVSVGTLLAPAVTSKTKRRRPGLARACGLAPSWVATRDAVLDGSKLIVTDPPRRPVQRALLLDDY